MSKAIRTALLIVAVGLGLSACVAYDPYDPYGYGYGYPAYPYAYAPAPTVGVAIGGGGWGGWGGRYGHHWR